MRTIPAELVARYEQAGWWTRETIGQVLAASWTPQPDAGFRVYSAVRTWSGTFRDVERVARRPAAGLHARGTVAADPAGPGLIAFTSGTTSDPRRVEEVRNHLAERGVARQKWPEVLLEADDYPRTASGKVQKRLVRERIALTSE